MKEEVQYFINGVDEGEMLLITPHIGEDLFIFTVLAPAIFACSSRQQMLTISSRLAELLGG